MSTLTTYLEKSGLSLEEFKARKRAWLFYDKDTNRLNRDIENYNKGIILICSKCSKVDINPIKHASDCDPAYEYERQLAQGVYWK